MPDYKLSQRADSDLLDIFVFGIEQFGLSQAELYQQDLTYTFKLLAETPHMGRLTETLGDGVRRHEHGRHVILYEETVEGIFILALVHHSSVQRLKL